MRFMGQVGSEAMGLNSEASGGTDTLKESPRGLKASASQVQYSSCHL